MKSILHGFFGLGVFLTIFAFWTSTLISELFLNQESIILVKQVIAKYGIGCLVVFMMGVGSSGFSLGKNRKGSIIEKKKKRMPIIALNGILIMIPSALFLNFKAAKIEFDFWFYIVQIIELSVGMIQITLLGMNFRDGLKLSGRLKK